MSPSSNAADTSPEKPAAGRRNSISDAWLSALAIWYLSGLLAALGFSFGLDLLRPAQPARASWTA